VIQKTKIYTALGLMSGTSMDGVDAAIIKTDGEKVFEYGKHLTFEYPKNFREKLSKLISLKESATKQFISEVETELTNYHITAVKNLCENYNGNIDVIGFHGHTIDHQPNHPTNPFSWQIGNGKMLADATKTDVVFNFRANDVKNGGQGAPLMPVYHKAVAVNEDLPIVIVNIGGVANITYIDENSQNQNDLIAFDTGTGNALIDDEIFKQTGKRFDHSGNTAMAGIVNQRRLAMLLADEYFNAPPPKSLDRQHFKKLAEGVLFFEDTPISFENKIATLSEFTVQSVVLACKHLPKEPKKWFVGGGGIYNLYFMKRFKELLNAPVASISALNENISPDALEAQGFAYMAVRSLLGLPISFHSTTGVGSSKSAATGGELVNHGITSIIIS
jgi:anhydro-N-acetylmuramic acid kinase